MSHSLRTAVGMTAVYSCLYVIVQLHRAGGAVIAPALTAELGLGGADLGLVIGIMFIASACTQPLTGVLLDRWGTVRTVCWLSVPAVTGTLLFAWSDSVLGLTVARWLIGAGFSCVVSGLFVFLMTWVSRENFTTAAALVMAIPGTLSVLVASTPLAVLLAEVGRGTVFVGVAVATVAVVICIRLVLREGPLSRRDEREPETFMQSVGALGGLFRNRGFLLLWAFGLTTLGPAFSLTGLWAGLYLRDLHGLEKASLGNAVFAMLVALNLGNVMYGPLDRWLGSRKKIVTGGIVVEAALFLVLAALPGLGLWPAVGLFVAIAAVSPLHVMVVAHAQSLFDARMAGRAITTINISLVGGVFVWQGLSGLIVEFFTLADGTVPEIGYRATFAALAGALLFGLVFYSRVPDPRAAPAAK